MGEAMRKDEIAIILREIERTPTHMAGWVNRYEQWPHNAKLALLLAAEHLENCKADGQTTET